MRVPAVRRPPMTDQQLPPTEPKAQEPPADQGTSPEAHTASSQAREWLAQLQQMIDQVAAHAAPVARDVAAKAAELAAVAIRNRVETDQPAANADEVEPAADVDVPRDDETAGA